MEAVDLFCAIWAGAVDHKEIPYSRKPDFLTLILCQNTKLSNLYRYKSPLETPSQITIKVQEMTGREVSSAQHTHSLWL